MPANLTSTVALPSTVAAANVPVSAKPAKRVLRTAKPAAAKPVTVAPAATPAPEKRAANVTRDIAGIKRNATNFNGETDRDRDYLAFFASFAGNGRAASFKLADVKLSGKRPSPTRSGAVSLKPTDVGAINRLIRNGMLASSADGASLSFTAAGKQAKL